MKKRITILSSLAIGIFLISFVFIYLKNKPTNTYLTQNTLNNSYSNVQENIEKNFHNLVGDYRLKEDVDAFAEVDLGENKLNYKVEENYFESHSNPLIYIEQNRDSKKFTITIDWKIYKYNSTTCKNKIWKMTAELDYEWYENNQNSKIIRLIYNNGSCGIFDCKFPEGVYSQDNPTQEEKLVQEIYNNGEGYFEWDNNILTWSGDINGNFKNYIFKKY